MKKFLAVLISAILLLGIFAGCNAEQPAGTDTTDGTTDPTPMATGMLVLNANASVNITYDADGFVLNVEGADNDGTTLAADYTDYLGKSCSDVIRDLIGSSKTIGYLNKETNYVMIKQTAGSPLPGATSLETIRNDAEASIEATGYNAKLILLTEEDLDDDGYINLESATQLMLAHLALDRFDSLDGTITPLGGKYGFTITAGDLAGDYIVDAVTGDVSAGQLEGVLYGDGNLNEEINLGHPSN